MMRIMRRKLSNIIVPFDVIEPVTSAVTNTTTTTTTHSK